MPPAKAACDSLKRFKTLKRKPHERSRYAIKPRRLHGMKSVTRVAKPWRRKRSGRPLVTTGARISTIRPHSLGLTCAEEGETHERQSRCARGDKSPRAARRNGIVLGNTLKSRQAHGRIAGFAKKPVDSNGGDYRPHTPQRKEKAGRQRNQ